MQSRQLLYTRLLKSEEECPLDLEEISGQILEKCAGLPLAIVAISGVLAVKTSKKDQWERVRDSIGRALRDSSIETMKNIISLSYFDLPPNLRTCLLYLSIFPKDHIIEKENLIRRWIGEGVIHKQGGRSLHESGELCFNELINRSLIQPAEIDGAFGGHEVKSCRVHDTIRDFIVSKAVEENFVTIIDAPGFVNPDPLNKIRLLSLQHNGEIPPDLVVSHARSLHVFGRNVKIPSLSDFRLLRVLDFEECAQVEDDDLAVVGDLLHLKYLRFRNAHSMTELPEELARLQNLEIDIHGYNGMMEIPEIIQQLLVCYVTVVSDGWTTLPDEIANIQGL
jgi:disease resistance protein RPM1